MHPTLRFQGLGLGAAPLGQPPPGTSCLLGRETGQEISAPGLTLCIQTFHPGLIVEISGACMCHF